MRVVTTPVPTAQSVSVNVFVGVGSRAENLRTSGLSHYLEHMMFKGTERRPSAIEIAEAIEGAGGILNAYTTQELTCYWNRVPFDKLALAMDVLADMMQRALIDEEELNRERSVVQQEIRRGYDNPASHAADLLARACFGDQPLGWPVVRTVPERYAETILNAVLGRGMSSRLFKEVREKRGLAYSIGSAVARYQDTG